MARFRARKGPFGVTRRDRAAARAGPGRGAGPSGLRRRPVRRAVLGDAVAGVRVLVGPETDDLHELYAVPLDRRGGPWLRVNMVSTRRRRRDRRVRQERLDQQRSRQARLRPPALGRGRHRRGRRHRSGRGLPADRPPDRGGQPARPAARGSARRCPGHGADRSRSTTPSPSSSPWPTAAGPTSSARAVRRCWATCSPRAWSTSSARRRSRGWSAATTAGSCDGPPVDVPLRLHTLLESDGTLLARWLV